MLANRAIALRLSTGHEGKYVNHPNDPGGPTNHGITQATLSAFLKRKATIDDVKSLSLETAAKIYVVQYMRPIWFDELPAGIDYAMFDFYINSGAPAVSIMQEIVGVAPDKIMGKKTLNAIESYIAVHGAQQLIKVYAAKRMEYLHKLRTFKTFGRGWTIRVTGVDPKGQWKPVPGVVGEALLLARDQGPLAVARSAGALPEAPSGKARDSDVKILAPTRNKIQAGVILAASAAPLAKLLDAVTPYKETFEWVGYITLGLTVVLGLIGLVITIDKIRSGGINA